MPDYFLHRASVRFFVDETASITIGVRNIFDTEPPRVSGAAVTTIGNAPLNSQYDYVGRSYFVNTNFRF